MHQEALKRATLAAVPEYANSDTEYFFPAVADDTFTQTRIDRNKGWLSDDQLRLLGTKKVSIAGGGGIGGWLADSLYSLYLRELSLADPGYFDVSNIHRQFGAMLHTVGKSKMLEIARLLRMKATDMGLKGYLGISEATVRPFLDGADAANDAIEFHAIGARYRLNRVAAEKRVPVFNGNSIGFGTNLFLFEPGGATIMDAFPADFDQDYADMIEGKFMDGTVTGGQYDFICNAINGIYLSDIPNYGGKRYDTRVAFLRRLFVDRTASIVSTNPKMAAGVVANRILLYLVKELDMYENYQEMPVFPDYLHFDSAQWKAEIRTLNLKKIRHDLTESMPRA